MGDLRTEIQSVYDKAGYLDPATLLKAATPKSSPLHKRFDWDDKAAAHHWRLEQAHELIQSVRISYKDAGDQLRDIRAFHALRAEASQSYTYEPAETIVNDPAMMAIVLRDMEREWQQLRSRYEQFREFAEMVRTSLAAAA